MASLRSDQAARRQRIIDTAALLMADVDYEHLQVKDVADEAQVALGTLYRYFSSKDHLFAAALLSWSERFGEPPAATSGGLTVDRVKRVYRRAARAFERQPRIYRVLMHLQASTDPQAAEVWRAFARRQSGAFGRALETSRMPAAKRDDVIAVMNAVLDENLRNWQLGLQPFEGVTTAIDRAADLIFGR